MAKKKLIDKILPAIGAGIGVFGIGALAEGVKNLFGKGEAEDEYCDAAPTEEDEEDEDEDEAGDSSEEDG